MRFGVVVFPGSNCDQDCVRVLRDVLKQEVVELWHQETSLKGCDCVVLPGGFSYGDYLRTGAVARFSPIMRAIEAFAKSGGLVLGICNGFQILLESGLLPGAMLRNTSLRFICRHVHVRVERADAPLTKRCRPGQVLRLPIAHNEGNYFADRPTLAAMRKRGQILLRYSDADGQLGAAANPNGSVEAIAGICNEAGNVMGMMPHPERASEPELGSMDGRMIFESLIAWNEQRTARPGAVRRRFVPAGAR
ncbi:MAG: phosphoribosylformylglycinamidine synthase subunit PurQ [Candidatus Omnitrophica bacterium]|nr:phosphoribosylformylglycinamidine synthase subunit PurQ [Candidatus Omnitrophota bacterium]